jgi:hypothetical protein
MAADDENYTPRERVGLGILVAASLTCFWLIVVDPPDEPVQAPRAAAAPAFVPPPRAAAPRRARKRGRGWAPYDVRRRDLGPDRIEVSGKVDLPDGTNVAIGATDGTRRWVLKARGVVASGRFRVRGRVPGPLQGRRFRIRVHVTPDIDSLLRPRLSRGDRAKA